ncbi:3-oxoacyl-ACP synthase [Mucilaginibacter sp. KACC 22063]|uniref:3-oxoacyl-ACP synthase n=1 Tax=Mucilaginibacter sp. KACC 22063 TaxID=3025666 RepID=UPI002365B908|nr:3-oxoacyl-ACP synthase [Mucilaginibacter sp. KACC 22063]WDF56192.1 3-oxoacyl-ACP synthase [Mucilaginibacter sp. KACC 22063]
MNTIKELLHAQCVNAIQQRIANAQQGIDEAKQASENETKSSAGDKYETGRAMMQQENDRNTALLLEAKKQMAALNQIGTTANTSGVADTGSLVITDQGSFYMAVGAGNIVIEGKTYIAISVASPIGLRLKGKTKGDQFDFNGRKYNLTDIL